MKIAALEDDGVHASIIARAVMGAGFECVTFSTGQALRQRLREEKFDMLIIDWQLPDISGRDFILWFRSNFGHDVPVLLVTARNLEEDVVNGLSAGADDYMIKPIRSSELAARVCALLRRAYQANSELATVIEVGGYRLDPAQKTVYMNGVPVSLTPREFELAHLLFQNIGHLLPRDLLKQAVWGWSAEVPSRTLDTHLSRLRTKLELRPANGVRLSSIYSQGYRLETVAPSAETNGNGGA